MVLGIRYGEYYEMISTFGIPLSHYVDRVPADLLAPDLFAREVEVKDLRQQAEFIALSIAPMAKQWRYGGNCPVRLPHALSDDGVLALSCADTKTHETGGRIINVLRQHAEFLSDVIWLSNQVQRNKMINDPASIIRSVLQGAVARFALPVCIIDADQRILGHSREFASAVRRVGGAPVTVGARLSGPWLSAPVEEAIVSAIASGEPQQKIALGTRGDDGLLVDLYPFSFPGQGTFTIVSLYWPVDDHVIDPSPPASEAVAPTGNGDGTGPVSRFLEDTLIKAQRLNRRNDTSYLTTRRWRSSIRKYQISAMRALKADAPEAFVQTIAAELANAMQAVHGSVEHCVVVPVPCGHSGENCLSARLAKGLAARLGVPLVDAFKPIDTVKGTSHPRKNASRASMRLANPVKVPVILVDDIATSGSHIDEAAKILRTDAPSVWPIAWIGP